MSLPGGDRSALESSSTFVCDRTPLIRYSPLPEKVLHLDPKKIIPGKSRPEAQKQLFERQLIFTWPHKFMSAGLVNLRNTCFLASVVQCLQHIPALNGYLMHQHGRHSEERPCVVCMMSRLTRLCFTSTEPVEPKELANNLQEIASHLIRGRQEDAHEFLHSLLNRMQEDLMHGIDPKPNQYEEMTTPIGQIFGGFLRSQIVCLGCNRASNSYESLLSISLEIKSARSLEESLDSFVSSEDMGAEEWYSCETCKMKQRAVKSYSIDTPPRILIIHLKRYNQVDRFQSKLSNHVEFKERLNLEPYVNSERKTEPLTYDLSSVLVHLGTQIGAGHYYSYVADPSTFDQSGNRSWFVMNDEVVQPTSWSSVRNSEAYLLFYVRTDCKLKTGDHSRPQLLRPKEILEPPSILPSLSIPRLHLSLDHHSCPDNLSKDAKPCSNSSKFSERSSNSGDGPKHADNHQNRLITSDKRDSFKQPDQLNNHGSGDHVQHSSSKRKLSDSFEPSQKRQKISEEASKCHASSSSEVPSFRNETKRSHDKSEPPVKESHHPVKSLRRHYSDFSHHRKRSRSRSRHESRSKRSFSRDRRHRSRSKGERSRDRYDDRSRDRCQRERSRSRADHFRDDEPYRHERQRHSYPWSKSYYRDDIQRDRWRHHWSPSRRNRSRERDRRDNSRKSRERCSRS